MHIYFNIYKIPSLNKTNIYACIIAYIINMHRISLNMHKTMLLQMVPHNILVCGVVSNLFGQPSHRHESYDTMFALKQMELFTRGSSRINCHSPVATTEIWGL